VNAFRRIIPGGADFYGVLARFEPEERRSVEEAIGRAADAVETFVTEGIEPAMNRFNARDDKATVE